MKTQLFTLGFAVLFVLFGCKNDTIEKIKEVKNQVSTASTTIGNISEMEENAKKMESQMEDLKKLTPITSDSFKNWMPEEVDGFKRTSYEFLTILGAQGNLEFENESTDKKFKINIIDGAGESGAAVFASQGFITGMYGGFESESDTKKEEIIERNGAKSMETYYKEKNDAEIKTTFENRFVINASGSGMNTDELYALIEKLNIYDLK